MKVMIDLNVLLDVIQKREPHFGPSAAVVGAFVKDFGWSCHWLPPLTCSTVSSPGLFIAYRAM
jgi:hypothetical protein